MRRVNCLVSLFTVLIAACNAPAQQTNVSTIPNLVNYSGTLLQLRNVAIPLRTVGVTFAIYKQQEGGAPVWLETQNVTVDGSGHYSVVLGTMQAEGLPSDLFAAQEERWLGVKSEGRPEQPRVMLVSVPYAFKAHEAETLGGMPASAFALASESSRTSAAANTSITAAAALTQNNEVRIGLSQGHGTKGYVPLWLNALYLGNSALFQDINRNIGIGTITPAATLDVNGPINTSTSYGIGGQPVLSSPDNVNLFVGINAGANNIGIGNTFVGFEAGQNNTQGGSNAFFGGAAGASNTTGGFGTFFGNNAGVSNTIGFGNSFFGADAGFDNTSGQFNNFFGDNAGVNNTTGSNNIYVANNGPTPGTESNTIRLGDPLYQTSAYIAGIYGSTSCSGVPVYINSNGQLGTLTSSIRFKEQIRDIGENSSALMKLRPVTFFYKPEYETGERTLQYGLIAEEVAKVYPELVVSDKDGQPYTVKYQYLTTMLLNELQKEHRKVEELKAELVVQNAELRKQNEQLEQRLMRVETLLQSQRNSVVVQTMSAVSMQPEGNRK